jgi:transcriptional accessory protein Tex/SPT6
LQVRPGATTRAAAPPPARTAAPRPAAKAPTKASRDRTPRKQPAGTNSRKNAALRKLGVGQILSGSVKNITDFGAFVDLGDVDGLIHKSRLGRRRIDHPSDVVTVGETVEVIVVEVDVDQRRVALALKTK